MKNNTHLKIKVQKGILIVSTFILLGKFAAFIMTQSVGILTDAMESIVNVIAGFVTLLSIIWSAQPRDREHPFGHGKIESISASLEGFLISIAGIAIIYEGFHRIWNPVEIQKLDYGIYIIAFTGVINYIMGWYSIKLGRKYNSIALIAGGKHLHSDTISTIGLVLGLIVLYFTEIVWIDSALALIFGSIILYTGINILRETISNLVDRIDEELLEKMVTSINEDRYQEWIDIHNTKIIKYGHYLFIDCDLTLPWYYNVKQGHDVCDTLKKRLQDVFGNELQLSVHSDPCQPKHCSHCKVSPCPHRKADFESLLTLNIERIMMTDEQIGEEINRLQPRQ